MKVLMVTVDKKETRRNESKELVTEEDIRIGSSI